MQAILRIVTEKDLLDYVAGRLDKDGEHAVSRLMGEDRSVRNLISQFSEEARSPASSDVNRMRGLSKN